MNDRQLEIGGATGSGGGYDRRRFLRDAAVTGIATAWATPIVQTIGSTAAFATTGSPRPTSSTRTTNGGTTTNSQGSNTNSATTGFGATTSGSTKGGSSATNSTAGGSNSHSTG